MDMMGSGNILRLVLTGRHTDTTNRTGNHLILLSCYSCYDEPQCPSGFPSVHDLLLVLIHVVLQVLGVVRLLVHGTDGDDIQPGHGHGAPLGQMVVIVES